MDKRDLTEEDFKLIDEFYDRDVRDPYMLYDWASARAHYYSIRKFRRRRVWIFSWWVISFLAGSFGTVFVFTDRLSLSLNSPPFFMVLIGISAIIAFSIYTERKYKKFENYHWTLDKHD